MKKILLIFFLTFNTVLFAQYTGGIADGYSKSNAPGFYRFDLADFIPLLLMPSNNGIINSEIVDFYWVKSPVSNVSRFQLSSDSSFNNIILDSLLETENLSVLINSGFNRLCFWRVQAYDTINITPWSEVSKFTVLKMYSGGTADGYASLKNVPANINNFVQKLSTPLNMEKIKNLTPTFDWIYFWGSTSFHIQISLDSNFTNVVFDEEFLLISELELEEGILSWNNVYFWRVRTFIDSLYSPWSEVWNFSTKLDSLKINLSAGWNTVSSFYIPYISNLFEIFSNLNEQVKVIKNEMGQICIPALGINQIGDWNVLEGYQIYATESCRFFISGEAITPDDTPIELSVGWHLVSYLRSNPMSIVTALQSISGSMLFAKNRMGDIYHLTYGINNIGNMIPGQGYWIYLTAPAVLTYPGN